MAKAKKKRTDTAKPAAAKPADEPLAVVDDEPVVAPKPKPVAAPEPKPVPKPAPEPPAAPSSRPPGAPDPKMVDAEYETAGGFVFKIKQQYHAEVGCKKVIIPK